MSEEKPLPTGMFGAAADVSRTLITSLPPVFIMLCLINCIFLGAIVWFLSVQIEQRTALVSRIVERCMDLQQQVATSQSQQHAAPKP